MLWRENIRLATTKEEHDVIVKSYHDIYRDHNLPIVAFWKTCQSVIKALVRQESGRFGNGNIFWFGQHQIAGKELCPSVLQPSGYALRYPNLRAERSEVGKLEFFYDKVLGRNIIPTRIYSSLLAENLTQSLAFQVLMYQAVRIAEKGWSIKANIHDSFACVVPTADADRCAQDMIDIMRVTPPWVPGLPLDAEAEIGRDFSIA